MKRTLQITLLLCGLLLAWPALAQDRPARARPPAETPQWLQVMVVRVKPEMVTEFQEFQKNETLPALKKAGVKWRDAWVTATFGDTFEYVFVTPIEKFAQYDNPNPIVKALGEEGARAYFARSNRFLVSRHSYAVRTRPDLSYYGKMNGPPKLAVVSWANVAPGRTTELENFIKNEMVPVMKKAEVGGYWVSQTVFGGDAYQYVALVPHENFAEVDKGPPPVRALGQEGANRLYQKLAGIVTRIERSIVRYNPDLSIAPAPTTEKAAAGTSQDR